MSPDDPRHGMRAGYIAGCRDDCCANPNYRYQKRSKLRLMREGTQIIPVTATLARVAWWQNRGVAMNALTESAGIGYGTLAEMVAGERDTCLRSTERAVLSLTWNHINERALCSSSMTHRRLYSLMASGHTLAWIAEQVGDGLPISGRWRDQARVRVGMARRVAQVAHDAPAAGPSTHTAAKARNKGHQPIAAWDDPGDPALPASWRPRNEMAADDLDVAVVERLLAGQRIDSTRAQKVEALRTWMERGGTEAEFCRMHGLKTGRYKTPTTTTEAAA